MTEPGNAIAERPPLRIVQILNSLEMQAAGPSYSVRRLAEAEAAAGAAVEFFSLGTAPVFSAAGVDYQAFAPSSTKVPALAALGRSGALKAALRERAARIDVLHTHGLWLMPNVYPAEAARRAGKLFVISPRGMLGGPALQFSRRKKQLMWLALQGRAARSAGLFHATSESECEEIRALGLRAPVAVIPNGVDVVPPEARSPKKAKVVLSLGRIHPKKGLDRLVGAWSRLGAGAADWRLRIVGPDEGGHSTELRDLARGLDLANVAVEPPLFDADRLAAYREASVFVLPTLNENFAMTVAEALAAGTPVISTKGAPWGGLVTERCGWWVDHGEGPLAEALGTAMAMPPAGLRAMGERGRAWMLRDYSWDRVGRDMLDAYRWAIDGGAPPETIRR